MAWIGPWDGGRIWKTDKDLRGVRQGGGPGHPPGVLSAHPLNEGHRARCAACRRLRLPRSPDLDHHPPLLRYPRLPAEDRGVSRLARGQGRVAGSAIMEANILSALALGVSAFALYYSRRALSVTEKEHAWKEEERKEAEAEREWCEEMRRRLHNSPFVPIPVSPEHEKWADHGNGRYFQLGRQASGIHLYSLHVGITDPIRPK